MDDFTQDELHAAFITVIIDMTEDETRAGAEQLWQEVLDLAKRSREPQWQLDDIVLDANLVTWQRTHGDSWLRMGATGRKDHLIPVRPLKLLYSPHNNHELARRIRAEERARDDGAPI